MFVLHARLYSGVCINPRGFQSRSKRFQVSLPPGVKWLNNTSFVFQSFLFLRSFFSSADIFFLNSVLLLLISLFLCRCWLIFFYLWIYFNAYRCDLITSQTPMWIKIHSTGYSNPIWNICLVAKCIQYYELWVRIYNLLNEFMQ